MRRRLLAALVGITTVVLVALAVPVGLLVRQTIRDEASARLRSIGAGLLAQVDAELEKGRGLDARRLNRITPPGVSARVVTSEGNVDVGPAPAAHRISVEVDAVGETVELSESSAATEALTQRAWLLLAAIGAGGVVLALAVGLLLSRRLTRPLDTLASQAERLGGGDFSVTARRSGMSEIDRVGEALDVSARRIGSLLEGERRFSTHASHQLRTAVTVLRLHLEELAARTNGTTNDELEVAIRKTDALSATISSMLDLARTGRAGSSVRFDLARLATEHADDHALTLRQASRSLRVEGSEPVWIRASPGAIGQAIDVLLTNAERHGGGLVTLSIASDNTMAIVTVRDQGRGILSGVDELFVASPIGRQHGVGLPLARELIEAEGGSLVVGDARTAEFTFSLPIDLTEH